MMEPRARQAGAGPQPAIPTIPDRPVMPEPVVEWLEDRLRTTQCFLEYGAGGSTRLAASLGVPRIVSVESDRTFAKAVRDLVAQSGSPSIHDMVVINVGRTGDWGYPVNFKEFRRWPGYSLAIWDFLRKRNLSPDLILIDGRFRVGCFLASLLDARPGTAILFDDYDDRRDMYGVVEACVKPRELIDRSAVFEVPAVLPRLKIARALARYISYPD